MIKSKNKIIYLFEIILLLFIICYKVIFLNNYSSYSLLINVIFWILFTIVLYLSLGYTRDKNYYKKTSIQIVIIVLLFYFLINFLLGFILGFTRNIIDYKIIEVLKNVVPYIIIFSLMELSRYLILKKNIGKLPICILVIEYIVLSIFMAIDGKNLSSLEYIFIAISTFILPIAADELLCTYLTREISYIPSIIYKSSIQLYIYVFAILPVIGNYLISVFGIIFPFIIFIETRKALHYHDKYHEISKKRIKKILSTIFIVFFVIIISLITGLFKHELVAIMTNSMEPAYKRGDAVIITKKKAKDIKVGEVLAFDMGDGIVTHRVIKINKEGNSYTFITKGDANIFADKYEIKNKNVIGTVDYILKYSGYPTILVRELFERG